MKIKGNEKACHPLVACIYEKNDTQKPYYLVMEYIEGSDLHKCIDINKKHKFINDDDVIKVMDHMIRGIDYLHSQHIIHMDIKPVNIMIKRNQFKLKIIDMGIACLNYYDIDDPKFSCFNPFTKSGLIGGTPRYISPEIVIMEKYVNTYKINKKITEEQFQDIYIKNDIWALGITFALLCNYYVPDNLGQDIAKDIMEKNKFIDLKFISLEYKSPIIKKIIEGCLKTRLEERLNTKQLIQILDIHYGRDVEMI